MMLLECDDLGKAKAGEKKCHLVAAKRPGSLRTPRERSVELRGEELSMPPRRRKGDKVTLYRYATMAHYR
jgi:hypothetical protein